MLEKLSCNLKNNLIELGFQENSISNLEEYLNKNKGNIIFPRAFSRKFNISFDISKDVLRLLLIENYLTTIFRFRYNTYIYDYYSFKDLPCSLEVNDEVITDILDRTSLLFKVKADE